MNILKSLTPTRREWRRWSKPTRLGIVFGVAGLILGVVGNALGVIPLLSRKPAPDPVQVRSEIPELFDPANPDRYVAMGFDLATIDRLAALLKAPASLDSARAMLFDLRQHSTSRKATDFLNGLITSTWYQQGRHREGLAFLLADATQALPPNDYRYRYQFYWHIRAIARIEGVRAAERAIDELRRSHRRAELSRVWIAAPFAAVEALRRGETPYDCRHDPDVDEDEREYLEGLLAADDDDAFRDHALYFLERYETVVKEHPNSLLRDAAMRTLVYDAFSCVAGKDCPIELGRERLAELAAEYPLLARSTAIKAAELLAASGRIADAESISCQGRAGCIDAREPVLRVALAGGVVPAEEVISWLAPTAPRLLETSLNEILLKLDRTPELARKHQYQRALAIYERSSKTMQLNGITPSAMFAQRLKTFRDLVATSHSNDAQSWFTHGLALTNAAPWGGSVNFAHILRNNAAEAFGRVKKLAPGSDLAAKASYLRAAALRRAHRFDASADEIEHFLATYHSSPLYDDMLAEKGLYYRNILWNVAAGNQILLEVANRFPYGNAGDNALTHVALTAEEQCRFADALALYERIVASYPGNRLALNAQQEARELAPVVASRFRRTGLEGVTFASHSGVFVADVERGSSGEKQGLTRGMKILTVNGTAVADVDGFYRALSALPAGHSVSLSVANGADLRHLPVVVGTVERYAAMPPNAGCGL